MTVEVICWFDGLKFWLINLQNKLFGSFSQFLSFFLLISCFSLKLHWKRSYWRLNGSRNGRSITRGTDFLVFLFLFCKYILSFLVFCFVLFCKYCVSTTKCINDWIWKLRENVDLPKIFEDEQSKIFL